jgi:hypothetical protein
VTDPTVAIARIWAAVGRIVKPERAPVPRAADDTVEAWLRGPLCDIATYRRVLAAYGASKRTWTSCS